MRTYEKYLTFVRLNEICKHHSLHKRMSEQEQNPLEQVDQALARGESFLEKNLNKIFAAVGAVLIVVAAWYGYTKLIKEPRAERASVALFKAEDRFITEQDSLALVGLGLNADGLEQVIDEYSGTGAANLAQVYRGIILYDAGKYQEAIDALKSFSSDDVYVGPSVIRLIGDCYAQLEKYDEAAKRYEEAAKRASNEAITPGCLIKAGHAYEKLGNKDKALALYNEVKDKYYTSPEAKTVEVDITRASAR